jgi:hypothetical protein
MRGSESWGPAVGEVFFFFFSVRLGRRGCTVCVWFMGVGVLDKLHPLSHPLFVAPSLAHLVFISFQKKFSSRVLHSDGGPGLLDLGLGELESWAPRYPHVVYRS